MLSPTSGNMTQGQTLMLMLTENSRLITACQHSWWMRMAWPATTCRARRVTGQGPRVQGWGSPTLQGMQGPRVQGWGSPTLQGVLGYRLRA